MTQIELRALIQQIVDEILQRHPALAGVEVRTTDKRICGHSHPSFEMMLYTEQQRELLPEGDRVFRRRKDDAGE